MGNLLPWGAEEEAPIPKSKSSWDQPIQQNNSKYPPPKRPGNQSLTAGFD